MSLNFDEITSTFVKTVGFQNRLDGTEQDEVMKLALEKITPTTDFIIFRADEKEHYEDEDRTFVIPFKSLKWSDLSSPKIYVKLDDFKGVETYNFDKRFKITFMLAEEY